MPLFQLAIDEDGMYYLWNGVRVDALQRSMWPWYQHVAKLGELHRRKDSLSVIRDRAAEKFFSNKTSEYANIYRHYLEVRSW